MTIFKLRRANLSTEGKVHGKIRKGITQVALISAIALLVLPIITQATQSGGVRALPSQGTIRYESPLLGGWGGITLYESIVYSQNSPMSIVFNGEQASDTEVTARLLIARGYTSMRVIFLSPFLENNPWWAWNTTWFERTLKIAKTLDMWLIVTYAGFYDARQLEDQWVGFWSENIISKYKDSYEKMIWEPINEPVEAWKDGTHELSGADAVSALGSQYQHWINMARTLGDTHWIVVSSVCWYNSLPVVDWFPLVNDPLDRIFLNMHFYYFYQYHKSTWTVADAESEADRFFQNAVVAATQKYGRPFLCTEMGADYGTEVPPDSQYTGSSNYSWVSLAYIQRLINNFDNYMNRVSYILWLAGDWSTAGLYGALNIWGNRLSYRAFV